MDVRDAREWWTMVTEAGVCGHCAAKGHSARYCPLNRHGNGNGNGNVNGSGKGKKMQDGKWDQLNAMIPEYTAALGSEMQADLEYLRALAENVP